MTPKYFYLTYPKLYSIWRGMHRRCYCKTNDNYRYYGARGITVCHRWHTFENFMADMGQPPEDTTLDRKDVNGNYEPVNCRWAYALDQANNKRPSQKYANNQTGISGVCYLVKLSKWRAKIGTRVLGQYSSLLDAAAARKSAENRHGQ